MRTRLGVQKEEEKKTGTRGELSPKNWGRNRCANQNRQKVLRESTIRSYFIGRGNIVLDSEERALPIRTRSRWPRGGGGGRDWGGADPMKGGKPLGLSAIPFRRLGRKGPGGGGKSENGEGDKVRHLFFVLHFSDEGGHHRRVKLGGKGGQRDHHDLGVPVYRVKRKELKGGGGGFLNLKNLKKR